MVRFHAFSIFTGSQEPTPTQKQTSMKRIFTFFFALLSACTFSAYAAVVDGTCGTNLTWTLNTKDSTLVISGTGEMTSTPWFDYRSYIKYVILPDGLTSIGDYAFDGCSSLTSITIPNTVTSIGDYAFIHCSSLTSVTLGNSVTSIGKEAFKDCSSLTSITIPNSVTSIGENAFYYCSSLTSVTLGNSITTIEYGTFSKCSSLTSVTLGNSVTSIGKDAFQYCSSLTSITIPNSVTTIGYRAFQYCSSLTSVTLGNSVTSIEAYAFYRCENLTSITIPNNVTSIGDYAFSACSRLTSVTLGKNLTSIGWDAFQHCSSIREVTAFMPTPPAAVNCGINPAAATLYVPAEYIGTYSNTLWWEDFKEIRAIDADYVVTFFDWDDTVLARVTVAAGEAATAPADPVREGYTFIGWDKDFSFVNSNLDVYAQYQMDAGERDMTLVFKDQDNNQLSTQSITVMFPPVPDIKGFTFLYWKTIDARIDDVITIQAVYESDSPTAAPEVYVNPTNPAQKLIRNGQVYILQYGKTYTITGQRL